MMQNSIWFFATVRYTYMKLINVFD